MLKDQPFYLSDAFLDVFLESTGTLVTAIIFLTLLGATRHHALRSQPGSRLVLIGFGLILFGLAIDITDNFPELNYLVIVGDTPVEAFLEKVVGVIFGLSLVALGFRRWIPSILELERARQSLDLLNRELDERVQQRTSELEGVNQQLQDEVVERKKVEERLTQQALHDALTDLPNRYAVKEYLVHEIARARRHGYCGAILFLDLDNFKTINDSLGHTAGDYVLKVVAERLNQCGRKEDFLGRLGGDEFVFVLPELASELQVTAELSQTLAARIISSLSEPILLGDHNLNVSTSIGIKLFPDAHEESADDLLRKADTALYHAKSKGPGLFSFFNRDMQTLVERRLNLARELREALAQEQLYLHYQPQVDGDGQVFGVEALLRWSHAVRGMVGPDEFIPLAEEMGIMDELGRYVVRRACAECSGWRHRDSDEGTLKVAVNISPSHFMQQDFVCQIEAIIAEFDLSNNSLVIEITEGVVIQDFDDISGKMHALRKMGVGISLDDFGTGYSSLAYIKRLPLDTLKIDRSFVQDIDTDPNNAAIIEAILAMTTALGIDVIAEGVEEKSQYNFLQQRGCNLFQGYLFGRPVPAADLFEADESN